MDENDKVRTPDGCLTVWQHWLGYRKHGFSRETALRMAFIEAQADHGVALTWPPRGEEFFLDPSGAEKP